MSATVPTIEAFNNLVDRVTALENPSPPVDIPDVLPSRIADLVEMLGVNTFSSMEANVNVWGSWPADYSPASVIAALQWLTNNSGFQLRLREYHYNGRESIQIPWLTAIRAALPDTLTSICVGANGSVNDIPTMIDMQVNTSLGVAWLEGINEPNTDFGSGEVPKETTLSIQQKLYEGAEANSVIGPSIVAGMPHPEGWITGYFGDDIDKINAIINYGNGHYYPPSYPVPSGTGWSVDEYVGGLWSAYAQHAIHITEFHSTLYSNNTTAPSSRDGYYLLLTWLTCHKHGTQGLWWYALFDYGNTYKCGLFPQSYANEPRSSAYAIRNLCSVVSDHGDRHNFMTNNLKVAVNGLPNGADWHLYQASNGTYYIALWYGSINRNDKPAVPITINFDKPVALLEDFDLLEDQAPKLINNADNRAVYNTYITPGVRMLVITP